MKQKLPESVWKEIRSEYQSRKTTCRALALKYGINRETVSSRCKVEKWRYGRQGEQTQLSRIPSQLCWQHPASTFAGDFSHRVIVEADQWLDRIQEAYHAELRYDRIEAIQKLLPQWKTVVEQVKKTFDMTDAAGRARPLVDVAVLVSSQPPPPRLCYQEPTDSMLQG
jgi:hypothetical protein